VSVVVVLGILAMASIVVTTTLAEPVVDISPTCGPAEPGFNIVINANGFGANGTVAYKFVNSNSSIVLYGYFDTNQTGGFNDVTFADDLLPGKYKLYFADDANADGAFDIGAKRIYSNVTIPCE
jgi:hypothetical protein